MQRLDARPLTFTVLPIGILLSLVAFGAQLLGFGESGATKVAQRKLKEVARCITAAATAKGGPPPLGEELHTLVVRCQSNTDLVEDAWGTPFVVVRLEAGFVVASCGPDLDCNTHDDLAAFGNWPGHELAQRAGAIPGWPTVRSAEGVVTELRSGLVWLTDNPWLGLCFIGIWGLAYGVERAQRKRDRQPVIAPVAPEPKGARARPSAPAADAPMLDDVLAEEALAAPATGEAAAPEEAAAAANDEAAAPEGDMDLDLGFEDAEGEAPPDDLDLMADDAPESEAPPADLSVDLGFEAPVARAGTPRPPSLAGAYSISRGAKGKEGEAPARLREEVVPAQRRVPTRRPPGAGKPAAARSKPGRGGVVEERFRDRGVVSETQRIQSHQDSKDPTKKP